MLTAYDDILFNHTKARPIALNKQLLQSPLIPEGFEPPIYRSEADCDKPLRHGTVMY